MTLSIRSFLLVIALLAFWLGALVSKSPLMLEAVFSFSVLLIVITLPFAIWDRRPEQRAYWTGFFVLGIGNLILSSHWGGYSRMRYHLAQIMVGAPPAQRVSSYYPTTIPRANSSEPTPV